MVSKPTWRECCGRFSMAGRNIRLPQKFNAHPVIKETGLTYCAQERNPWVVTWKSGSVIGTVRRRRESQQDRNSERKEVSKSAAQHFTHIYREGFHCSGPCQDLAGERHRLFCALLLQASGKGHAVTGEKGRRRRDPKVQGLANSFL